MNRIRLLTIGIMFTFALATVAQGNTAGNSAKDASASAREASPEDQLKVLTEKLDLTGDQQAKVKPILQELHDATQKIVQDESLTHDERLTRVRPLRYEAHKKILEILNDDQKKKLEQYLQGPHPEMHGNLTGATPSQSHPPQN